MSCELEKVTEDIDIAVDLLNLLKSRYFFLRAKYDIGKYPILHSPLMWFISSGIIHI